MLTHASIKVDLIEFQEALSLPQISDGPEQQHHREGEVSLEEVLGGTKLGGEGRSDGDEELCREGDENQEEADIGARHAEDVLEGDVVEGAALPVPCLAEANVSLFLWLVVDQGEG